MGDAVALSGSFIHIHGDSDGRDAINKCQQWDSVKPLYMLTYFAQPFQQKMLQHYCSNVLLLHVRHELPLVLFHSSIYFE